MRFLQLIFYLAFVSLSQGQFVRPSSVLNDLNGLEEQHYGYRSVKAAVRSGFLTQQGSSSTAEHLEPKGPVALRTKQDHDRRGSLESQLGLIFDKLRGAGDSIECSWDETLLSDLSLVANTKYLLAANFKDNEEVLPHIIAETWRFISMLPPQNLFVSIYESGSETQKSAMWLEVFSKVLELSGVQHQIVTGGTLVRGEDDTRIHFLAKVRNKALGPLWRLANETAPKTWRRRTNTVQPWKADRIIFMNDVFMCARDFMRLALHDADMACGLDFGDRDKKDPKEDKWEGEGSHEKTIQYLPHVASQRRQLKDMHVYDKWVVRDTDGELLDPKPPYNSMRNTYTKERLLAGLPFPVTSCWNGLVVMNAKPFLDGLHFRDHAEGECRASECSLLCHDFRRLNYTRIIVDPGVQLAYERHDAIGLHISDVVGEIRRTSWDDVRASDPIGEEYYHRDSEICCHEDTLNWSDIPLKCHRENFMEPNYTRTAFPEL